MQHHVLHAAIAALPTRATVFVHTAAAVPQSLTSAWASRLRDDVDVRHTPIHLHTEGLAPWLDADARIDTARLFFCGRNARAAVAAGRAALIPERLSQIGSILMASPPDVALISVSPPDEHGRCSLGPSVDVTLAALRGGRLRNQLVVAQINRRMPFIGCDLHVRDITHCVQVDEPLPASTSLWPTPLPENSDAALTGVARTIEAVIAHRCAALVADGACLQVGIGSIPEAVCAELVGHKRLGCHTEMLSDGLVSLIKCGALDNSRKEVDTGVSVGSFAVGTTADAALETSHRGAALYDYLDGNKGVQLREAASTNDPATIARNSKVTAINSAIEIDLTGQVCADSAGTRILSGPGGQLDFALGAAASKGGIFIIALPSTAARGTRSRIVATLTPGAGVVTPRSCVDIVVTEYGIARLRGKSLPERAAALIAIAHPSLRAALSDYAGKMA